MGISPIDSVSNAVKSIFDFFRVRKEKQLETFDLAMLNRLRKAVDLAETYITYTIQIEQENVLINAKELRKSRDKVLVEFYKYNN